MYLWTNNLKYIEVLGNLHITKHEKKDFFLSAIQLFEVDETMPSMIYNNVV